MKDLDNAGALYNAMLNSTYPYNFASKILGNTYEHHLKNILPFRINDCLKLTCTEREVMVVDLYFVKKVGSYKKVGEVIGVGAERVRQILQKIYRKMRQPSRAAMWIAEDPEVVKRLKEENKRYRLSAETSKEVELNPTIIHDLNLNLRGYNCLMRNGLTNLQDFDGLEVKDFLTIRNLGRRTAMEIIDSLLKYGFILKNEEAMKTIIATEIEPGMPLPDSYLDYTIEWPKEKEEK